MLRVRDDFRFMHETRQQGGHFLIRVKHNRKLELTEENEEISSVHDKLKDYARSLPSQHSYLLDVSAKGKQPARTAQLQLAWAQSQLLPHSTAILICDNYQV